MRLLEAGLWVAVVPTQAEVIQLAQDKRLSEIHARFYYTMHPTFLESLLDEPTAAALDSVRVFSSLAEVQSSELYGEEPVALEVTAAGQIVYDGRCPECERLFS